MTKRYCSSARIHVVPVEFQFIPTIDCHGRKGFVDFNDVDILMQVEIVSELAISLDDIYRPNTVELASGVVLE